MKKNRRIYFFILFLSLGYTYFYGSDLPYSVLYLVVIAPLISFLHVYVIYFGFKYYQKVEKKKIVKGEKNKYYFNIANEGLFFLPYIDIHFYSSNTLYAGQMNNKAISVKPNKSIKVEYDIECKYRGHYEIGISQIEIRDLLKLICIKYKPKEVNKIIVYPRIMDIKKIALFKGKISEMGENSDAKTNVGDIADIREYIYGDSLNKIHWKLSAKYSKIMIKEMNTQVSEYLIVYLDLRRFNIDDDTKIIAEDAIIEAATNITYYLSKNGIPYEFIYYNNGINSITCNTEVDFETIYNIMASIKFEQFEGINYFKGYSGLFCEDRREIYIFSIVPDVDLFSCAYDLSSKGHNLSLVHFNSPIYDSYFDDIVSHSKV